MLQRKVKKSAVLNYQQEKIMENELCDSKIIGNPGVGKTTMIIHKICRHFKNKDLPCKKSFLIVTFTNNARQDFLEKSQLDAVNEKDIFSNRNVLTLHKLAGKINQLLGNGRLCDVGTLISATTEMIKTKTSEEIKGLPFLTFLKLMIVDEAQDISESQMNFLYELKKKLNFFLNLSGDPNQNIFQFAGGSDQYLLDYECPSVFYLTINNRSTPKIVEFANYFRPNYLLPEMKASRSDHKKSLVQIYNINVEQIKEKVLDLLEECRREGVDFSNVAIIGPVKLSKIQKNYCKSIGLSIFENLFFENDIPFVQHYSTVRNDSSNQKGRLHRSAGKINLHTIHSSKGEEFEKVFLINFHFETQGFTPTYESYNQYMYFWWTAITRARDQLYIFIDDKKDHWPVLQTVPTHLYQLLGNPIQNKEFQVESPSNTKRLTIRHVVEAVRDDSLLELEKLLPFEIKVHPSSVTVDQELNFEDDLWTLSEELMKMVFDFMSHKKRKTLGPYLDSILLQYESQIMIPKKNKREGLKMFQKIGISYGNVVTRSDIFRYKDQWENDQERDFYFQLISKIKENKKYNIYFEDDLIFQDVGVMAPIIHSLKIQSQEEKFSMEIFKNLFYLTLYYFQYRNEKRHLWKKRQSILEGIQSLKKYLPRVEKMVVEMMNNTNDQNIFLDYPTHHPYLNCKGEVTLWKPKEKEVWMVVFKKKLQNRIVFELLLNYNNIYPRWDKETSLFIYNMYDGTKTEIFPIMKDKFALLKFLCKKTNQKLVDFKIFYALRTNIQSLITERFLWEESLQIVLSEGKINYEESGLQPFRKEMETIFEICDRPILIGLYGSSRNYATQLQNNIMESQDRIHFIDLFKVLHSLDPNLRRVHINKIFNKICQETIPIKKNLSTKEEVEMVLKIIRKLDLFHHKLI